MTGISFGGLSSGLDTGAIVKQLVAIRRQPVLRMENQKTTLQRSLTGLDDLKAALAKLEGAAEALDTEAEFNSKAARSGNEDVFTARAGSATPGGVYDITVNALAQTHREVSQTYAATTDSVGTGTFSFTLNGTTTDITLASGGDSLADLKSAINDADAGVSASLVNDGTGYRLLLSADESGVANQFTVDSSGLSGGTDLAITNAVTGADASITIDQSITVTSTTNTVSDALEGLSIDLQALGSTELTVENDATDLAAKIGAFSEAYNEVMDLLEAQSADGASLEGSSLVRTVRSRLGTTMTSRVDTGGVYGIAAEIGLSLDRYGKMSFDQSKLDQAIDTDYASVMELFTRNAGDGDLGISAAIKETVDGVNASTNGLIKFRKDSINSELERIDSRIAREERSLEIYEETLNRKFTAMEMTINKLQAQSGYLGF